MSKKADAQMLDDKAMRDSARVLVDADVDLIKSELKATNLAKRAAIRVKEGASEIYEEASETVSENKTLFSALLGAAVVLIASKPLLSLLSDRDEEADADQENTTSDEMVEGVTYEVTVEDSAENSDEERLIIKAEK